MKVFILKLILYLNAFSLSVSQQWMHSVVMDPLNKYHLNWSFDDDKQQITFNVVVETRGWVGFGISPNGGMTGSDLIIGWIDHFGRTHFHVRHQTFVTKQSNSIVLIQNF